MVGSHAAPAQFRGQEGWAAMAPPHVDGPKLCRGVDRSVATGPGIFQQDSCQLWLQILRTRALSLCQQCFPGRDGMKHMRDSLGDGLPDRWGELDAVLVEGLTLNADKDN